MTVPSPAQFMANTPSLPNGNSLWAQAAYLDLWAQAAYLELPSGHITLIDAADLTLVRQHKWYATKTKNAVYVAGRVSNPTGTIRTYLHRFLLGIVESSDDADHKNRIGLDNRRSNLRRCSRGQNTANQQPRVSGSTGYRGVSPSHNKSKPWRARLKHDGKCLFSGYFTDPWEAAQAYNQAAFNFWGEFALLNERLP